MFFIIITMKRFGHAKCIKLGFLVFANQLNSVLLVGPRNCALLAATRKIQVQNPILIW